MRETIPLAALIGDRKSILLPGLIEQRDHPVMEHIQKIPHGGVFLADALDDQLGVIQRQYSRWSGKAHEIDHHRARPAGSIRPVDLLDLTRRERKGGVRHEAYYFAMGAYKSSDRRAIWMHALKQTH